ncbi:MAG: hypothetical protein LAP21_21330 [Acidobacteriia bacterium]|nr:hypothetical protein [Terriglobia bacterium]
MAPGTVAVEATQSAANPVVSSPVGGNAGGDTGADSGGGVYEGSSGSSRSGGESGESYAGDGAREGASDASREPLSADDFDSLEDYAQALIEQRQNRADKDGEDQDWEGEGPDSEGLEDESPESEEPEGEEAEQQTADDEFESSLDRDEGRPGLELEEDDYFNPKLLNEKINASPELRAALEKSPELRNAMFRNARLASETSRYKELFPDVESARYAAETSATFRQLDDLFLNATTPEGTGRFLQKWAEMSVLADERGRPLMENGVPKLHPAFTAMLDNIRTNELRYLRQQAEKQGDQELVAALDIISERNSPTSAAHDELPAHIRATADQIRARETELNRRQLQQQHAEQARFDQVVGDDSTNQINALIEPALQKAALTDFVRQTAREKIDNAIVESLSRNRFFQARMAELSRYPLTAETRQQRVNLILSHVQAIAGPIVRQVLSQATAPVVAAHAARNNRITAQVERSRTEPRSTTGNFAMQARKSPEQMFEQIKSDYANEHGEEPSAQKLIELWTLARRQR